MDEVTIGDKTYISSKRAAELTGYAKDYVGQLCREGHVDAKMVGRGWYVYEPSIMRHRFGDAQAEAVEAPEAIVEEPLPAAAAWEPSVYKAETPSYLPELEPADEPVALESSEIVDQRAEMAVSAPAAAPQEDTTLTDMQAAWREWFDKKRAEQDEMPEIESPEGIDARSEARADEISTFYETVEANIEEEAVAIPLHRIDADAEDEIEEADEPVYEAPVAIHRVVSEPSGTPSYAAQPVTAFQPTYTVPVADRPYEPVREPEARIVREQIVRKGSKSARRQRTGSNAPITALFIAISIVSIAIAVIGSGFAGNYLTTLAGENAITRYLVGERVLNK